MTDDLWTIVGNFGDKAAAEVLGDYFLSRKVPCRMSEPTLMAPNQYSLLIPNRFVPELDRIYDWVKVADYSDAISASLMANRLNSAGIPATADAPSQTNIGPFNLSVPRDLRSEAEECVASPPVSDDELTALALGKRRKKSD